MTPYKIGTTDGKIVVTGPSLMEPIALFTINDAKKTAAVLNDAWNAGWNTAYVERKNSNG